MNTHRPFKRPLPVAEQPKRPPRLDLYMPATPPLALIAIAEFWFKVYWRRYRFRRQFVPLLKQSDHLLADMGLTRGDIRWALSQSVRVDALSALAACRQARQDHNHIIGQASQRAQQVSGSCTASAPEKRCA